MEEQKRRCVMPRGPRVVYEDALLNITSRGNNKRIIFRKEKDYRYFKKLLLRYKFRYKLRIYHYSLMRNHVHLLLKIINPITLSKAMQGLQLAYFHYYRRRYGYVGRFWQGRFYSKVVKDDRYLLTAGLYIERNPVRAGLVKYPAEYKWSSYNVYAYGIEDPLVDLDPHYHSLGNNEKERHKAYREIMVSYLKMENEAL
jgi:putative transposase